MIDVGIDKQDGKLLDTYFAGQALHHFAPLDLAQSNTMLAFR